MDAHNAVFTGILLIVQTPCLNSFGVFSFNFFLHLFLNLNYEVMQSLMLCPRCEICTLGSEQIPLEPLPHLCLWASIMFFPLGKPENIYSPHLPLLGIKGLCLILFVCLSTIHSFSHLILSATPQGHYYVAVEETEAYWQVTQPTLNVSSNSKSTFFISRLSSFSAGMTGLAYLLLQLIHILYL